MTLPRLCSGGLYFCDGTWRVVLCNIDSFVSFVCFWNRSLMNAVNQCRFWCVSVVFHKGDDGCLSGCSHKFGHGLFGFPVFQRKVSSLQLLQSELHIDVLPPK